MRLSWQPVDGAIGYLVHRAPAAADGTPMGDLEPVDHQGGDVLAVPDAWYVDTTGEPGRSYAYAVASVPEVTVTGALGDTVAGHRPAPQATEPPLVELQVETGGPGSLCTGRGSR